MASHTRRTMVAALTGVGLAGCTSIADPDAQGGDELPDQCPTTLDLDVEWPRELTTESAAEFVTEYEEAYLFNEQHGDSEFVDFNIGVQLNQGVSRFFRGFWPYLTGGFQITVNSRGSVVTQSITIAAVEANPDGTPKYSDRIYVPEDSLVDTPELIPIDEIEYQQIRDVVKKAAESGSESQRVSSVPTSEQYTNLMATLPANSSSEDNDIAYFEVDGTVVLFVVSLNSSAPGLWRGTAQYYVTENVVWRSDTENETPRNGTLVECRPSE